jgi:hypothetical protein
METITLPLRKKYRTQHYCKKLLIILFVGFFSYAAHSQLAVTKMIGKNSDSSKLGFGVFAFWDIPVNDIGNRSVVIELMDLAFFPPETEDAHVVIGYLSIKAGYKYIFSEETRTGFYVEPSAGYCRVVSNEEKDDGTSIYGDGVAVAAEAGYTVEVGQKGNNLNFGLKYERDMAGSKTTVSSIAFRFSYAFHLFRKKSE